MGSGDQTVFQSPQNHCLVTSNFIYAIWPMIRNLRGQNFKKHLTIQERMKCFKYDIAYAKLSSDQSYSWVGMRFARTGSLHLPTKGNQWTRLGRVTAKKPLQFQLIWRLYKVGSVVKSCNLLVNLQIKLLDKVVDDGSKEDRSAAAREGGAGTSGISEFESR